MLRKKQVVVIGDSAEYEERNAAAFEIGKFIAQNNWVLISGGRGGVMQAACKGAHEEGGLSISLIPDDDLSMSNPYSSVVIPTGIGFARNYSNALSGDVIVIVGGGTGTLCELTYAWQANKPIIACSFIEGCSKDYAGKVLDYRREDAVIDAKTLDEVFSYLKDFLK